MDVYNHSRVSSGWQRCPPAERLSGEAQGCFTPQQRAAGEEAAGQRAPGPPQHQVRPHTVLRHCFSLQVYVKLMGYMVFSSCCVTSMKRAASLNYLNKSSDDPFQVGNTKKNQPKINACSFIVIPVFSACALVWLLGSRKFQTESGFELQQCGSLHWKLRPARKSPPAPGIGSMLHNTTRQNRRGFFFFYIPVLDPGISLQSAKLFCAPHPLLKSSHLLRFIYPSCRPSCSLQKKLVGLD